MRAILQSPLSGMPAGTEFVKTRKQFGNFAMEVFECQTTGLVNPGEKYWLSEGFVLGQFDKDVTPRVWTPELFKIVDR